jgi:putative oxidoreductase
MDANLILWILQILLAVGILASSYGHTLGFESAKDRPGMQWLGDVGRDRMRVIGILEILGAIGLVLPAATGILPWLTPLAAVGLAIIMALAAVYHARRPGESRNIVLNVILGLIAVVIAYGRIVVAPL